jgi:hypothetical protein
MACKLHFTTKYDLFKNEGRVPGINSDALNKNGARKHLIMRLAESIGSYRELVNYFVASYAYADNGALYNVMEADENYRLWNKNKMSTTQIIVDDLYGLNIKEIIMGDEPTIFRKVVGGEIHIESAVALNQILHFVGEDYFVFSKIANKIVKLDRFVKFDKEKVCTELELNLETA